MSGLPCDDSRDAGWPTGPLVILITMRLIGYRIDHGLSQTGLARMLGMHQPAIARLEAGSHEPSLGTLSRLARALGIEFHIDIAPDAFELRDIA